MSKFPFYKQLDGMDCGPSCLRMIAKYYGKTFSVQQLREQSYIQRTGVNLLKPVDWKNSANRLSN